MDEEYCEFIKEEFSSESRLLFETLLTEEQQERVLRRDFKHWQERRNPQSKRIEEYKSDPLIKYFQDHIAYIYSLGMTRIIFAREVVSRTILTPEMERKIKFLEDELDSYVQSKYKDLFENTI